MKRWNLINTRQIAMELVSLSSLQNPHKRYPIAHPRWGRDMGCRLWAQALFHVLPQLLQLWIQYCYIGPHYMTSDCTLFKRLCEITSANLFQLYLIGTLCCIHGCHALWESEAWCCCMPPGSIHLAGVVDSECTAPLLTRGCFTSAS